MKMKKFILGLTLAGVMASSFAMTAFAAEDKDSTKIVSETSKSADAVTYDDRGFVSDTTKGLIEIEYKADGKLLSGAEITITKIADVDTDLGRYKWEEVFQDKFGTEFNLEGYTADKLLSIAKEFSGLKFTRGEKRVTDGKGMVSFDAEAGLYLVEQTGKSGVAAEYYNFDPYLLSVPAVNEEGKAITLKKSDTEVIYYVQTLPKTATEKIPSSTPDSPPDSPGTPVAGLEFNNRSVGKMLIGISAGVIVIAMVGFIYVFKREKREKSEK